MPKTNSVCPYCENKSSVGVLNESEYSYRIRRIRNVISGQEQQFMEVFCSNCGKTISIECVK
ncbi:hypothetical protein CE91St28_11450 [Pyramidobacter piscolens]|nr:hypothetical protein CE91St28_11450 [Pyramidobacter piscolens]